MADEKYSFVVIRYEGITTSREALSVVRQLEKEKSIKLKDAVAVYKDEYGQVKLRQTKDMGVGKGMLKVGTAGLLVGLILGGPIAWTMVGAVTGGVAGAFDTRIKNDLMKELGEEMRIDQSALCVLIEDADWHTVQSRMKTYSSRGEVIVRELTPEHMAVLDKAAKNEQVNAAVAEEIAGEEEE
jgi:uncharacterized membrane protein